MVYIGEYQTYNRRVWVQSTPQFCLVFNIFAGSLESANSSILAARNLFKDFGGEK